MAVEPGEPPDEPRREHRRDPEDDDLNFTMLGVALLERCGTGFDALDVAKIWLDYMPPGRIFTAERVAVRNLLEAYLPPETATRRNPFREWIGARLRVDAYGWAAPGDPVAAARMAWEDARLSHTANGVYAAMFMAAAHAASVAGRRRRPAPTRPLGRPGGEPARRGAADRARARGRARVGGRGRRALRPLRRYHWVHAINNTALVAAALYAFDDDFSGAISAVVQGGWDTDTNGAAVGSIVGAAVGTAGSRSAGRRSAAASRARCPASTGSRSTSSSGGRSPSRARPQR